MEWFYRHFKLEPGLVLDASLVTLGGAILATLVAHWLQADMLSLPHPEWASLAATLIIIGCNRLFSSLFISAMSTDERGRGR